MESIMAHWICEPTRYKRNKGDWIEAPKWTKGEETFHRSLQAIIGANRWSSSSYNLPRKCLPGDTIWMSPGEHPFFRLTHSYDETGIDKQIHIRALDPANRPIIIGNPVTGSQTLYAEWAGGFSLKDMVLKGDDISMFQSENPSSKRWNGSHPGNRDIFLDNVDMDGGFNHLTNEGPRNKWGALVYEMGKTAYPPREGFVWRNSRWGGIYKEHAMYQHNAQGNQRFENLKIRGCGRTAFQFANRAGEGPDGYGNITFERCVVKDVCLEDGGGGSAFTFKGNHNGKYHLIDCGVQLGCDDRLHPEFQRNITGSLVAHKSKSAPSRYTKELELEDCHFEVGKHFVGEGSARRANLDISHTGTFKMHGCKVISHPGTREALRIDPDTVGNLILDQSNEVRGDVIYGDKTWRDPQMSGEAYRKLLIHLGDYKPFGLRED